MKAGKSMMASNSNLYYKAARIDIRYRTFITYSFRNRQFEIKNLPLAVMFRPDFIPA